MTLENCDFSKTCDFSNVSSGVTVIVSEKPTK